MATRALLEVEHVAKEYPAPDGGEPLRVLSDVSFTLAAGESLAIVGPSGSGKSTLLNIIGALDSASSGEVRLDGHALSGLSEAQLAEVRNRQIGFVFQLHHLLPQCSVMENVLIPTLVHPDKMGKPETLDRAAALLERVGLGERAAHHPGSLSGGERQRVAVVRALINGPRLLLADEPTGSLDRQSADALGGLLVELNEEEALSLVVVTHSVELAEHMERTQQLVDGAFDETCGPPVDWFRA